MLSPNGVRAVLFDLDGTLYQNRPSAVHIFYQFAHELGAAVAWEQRAPVQRWAHHYWARSDELSQDLSVFGSLSPQFWQHYCRRKLQHYGCSPAQAKQFAGPVSQRMDQEYKPELWIDPATPAMLQALKDAGFILGVVSNRGQPIDDDLRALQLADYFHLTLAAGQVNSWKPDPGIYQHVLKKLDLRPEQALYVGDNYYADIVGAHAAGLSGVLLDPEAVFPEAECAVIQTLPQVLDLL